MTRTRTYNTSVTGIPPGVHDMARAAAIRCVMLPCRAHRCRVPGARDEPLSIDADHRPWRYRAGPDRRRTAEGDGCARIRCDRCAA